MSDILRLIPLEPQYVPDARAQQLAQEALLSFLPEIQEITAKVAPNIGFVDQGENFERVLCPVCGAELNREWWQAAMAKAYTTGFIDLAVTLPCCGFENSLNELQYEGPAGFARFILEARNPNADVNSAQIRSLEQILGCTLRKLLHIIEFLNKVIGIFVCKRGCIA